MRRFGDAERFLELLDSIRELAPTAGIRSNVIVGFPGETGDDLDVLCDFLTRARLDATGVFGYSDEDGTEAASLVGKHSDDEIAARLAHVTDLVQELTDQRAEERVGERVEVLIESIETDPDGGSEFDDGPQTVFVGRAAHQGPEVDGCVMLTGLPAATEVGDMVSAIAVGHEGIDLHARAGSEETKR